MVYTVKYNQSSVPEVGDTLLVDTVDSDNESGEMSWGKVDQLVSVVYGDGSHSFTPPEGSYISCSNGSLTGGGLGTETLSDGQVYGPTDGSAVNLTVTSGEFAVVSQPI